jgi:hypothetical protein
LAIHRWIPALRRSIDPKLSATNWADVEKKTKKKMDAQFIQFYEIGVGMASLMPRKVHLYHQPGLTRTDYSKLLTRVPKDLRESGRLYVDLHEIAVKDKEISTNTPDETTLIAQEPIKMKKVITKLSQRNNPSILFAPDGGVQMEISPANAKNMESETDEPAFRTESDGGLAIYSKKGQETILPESFRQVYHYLWIRQIGLGDEFFDPKERFPTP